MDTWDFTPAMYIYIALEIYYSYVQVSWLGVHAITFCMAIDQ